MSRALLLLNVAEIVITRLVHTGPVGLSTSGSVLQPNLTPFDIVIQVRVHWRFL